MRVRRLVIKSFVFGIIISIFSLAISIVLGEFIVKYALSQRTYQVARLEVFHIFDDHPLIPFTLKKDVKNFHHIALSHEFDHYASTNSLRIRGKEFGLEKSPDTYRILFLGDSMTFGWGVEDEQTYPFLVEKYGNEYVVGKDNYKRIEVINAGFTDGLTIDSYYVYLKNIGSSFKPDLVIVNIFPYNDFSDMVDMDWKEVDARGYPAKIVSRTQRVEDGYIVSRKKTNWKYVIPGIRDSHLAMLFMDALERRSPVIVKKIKNLLGVEEDKRAFSTDENLRCIYTLQPKLCPPSLWPYFTKMKFLLAGIKDVTTKNGQDLLITIMPSSDQAIPLSGKINRFTSLNSAQPQKFFRIFFEDEGIEYLDLLPYLSEENAKAFYYNSDGHLTSVGTKVVAKEILRYLTNTRREVFSKNFNVDAVF